MDVLFLLTSRRKTNKHKEDKMKKTMIVVFIVSVFLMSCNKTSEVSGVAPAVQQQQTKEGGITSGGGGVLPANALYPFEVYKILKQAKTELRLFLNYERSLGPKYADMNSIDRFLYQDQNIAWALENTDLEYYADKPCYDEQGFEVDGSYLQAKPTSICISGFTTAPKLIAETAKKEIYALIIHELAHRVGANEVEAQKLQKNAVYQLPDFLKRIGGNVSYLNTLILFEHPLFKSNPWIASSFQKKFGVLNIDEKIEMVNQLLQNSNASIGTRLEPINNGSIDYRVRELQLVLERALNLLKGALLLEKGFIVDPLDQFSIDYYNEAFAQKDHLMLYDLGVIFNEDYFKQSIFAKNLEFKKIKSTNDYQSYLEILNRGYEFFENYKESMVHQNSLPDLPATLFEDQNPWKEVIGSYNLIPKNCELTTTRFDNLVGFEVEKEIDGAINFKFIKPNMSVGYNDIKNQNDQKIFKNGDDYVWQIIAGDRWPSEHSPTRIQQVEQIKLSKNQLTVTYSWSDFTPVVPDTGIQTCVYEVEKR